MILRTCNGFAHNLNKIYSIQVSLNEVSRTNPYDDGIGASFLLGHSGVYAVSAIVFNALGQCWPNAVNCILLWKAQSRMERGP